MAIAKNQLLTWSRIAVNRRAQITDELFLGGLVDLNDYTADEVKDALNNFCNHPTVARRFSLSASNSTKRS